MCAHSGQMSNHLSRLVSQELPELRIEGAGAGFDDDEGDVVVREVRAAGMLCEPRFDCAREFAR